MLSRLICALLIFATVPSFAANCLMADALKDPKLAQNTKFWEEYGALANKGQVPDDKMQALMAKHGAGSETSASVAANKSFEKSLMLEVHHKAEKEIKGLSKNLKQKVDEFLELAVKPGGMKELYSNPGRWHYEKLHDGTHTIRLNGDYRVNFETSSDGIKVLRVNADQIHKK